MMKIKRNKKGRLSNLNFTQDIWYRVTKQQLPEIVKRNVKFQLLNLTW